MKLKFEKFEGLTTFFVRGPIEPAEIKILQIGLDTLVKELESPLLVNLAQAHIPASLAPVLQAIKKTLSGQTKFKIHWISPVKNVGDFPTLNVFTSRLSGFKHRQISERLILEDQIYELSEQLGSLQKKVSELIGNEDKAHELILRHYALKEEERILKETIHGQKERMKLQELIPSENKELNEKSKIAREEIKKGYGMDLDL